jgi:hypothetical protein
MQQQQQANGAKIPYAAVVKNSPAKNLADQVNARQNDRINYAKMEAKCIKDMDPLKTNRDQRAICEIKKRLQQAKRTLESIQKLNSDHQGTRRSVHVCQHLKQLSSPLIHCPRVWRT